MSKSIACLLALSVSTSLAFANGGGGGEGDKKPNPFQSGQVAWKPGSGITLADTDEFGLRLANQLQVQWAFTANDIAPDTNSFTVRRARMALAGHVYSRDLRFMLRLDAVDDTSATITGGNVTAIQANGPVKDAWIHWDFTKSEDGTIGLRLGQSKTYHGLEATGSSSALFFVERSSATRMFSDARSRGAWAHGSHNENQLRWAAGIQNGDVANSARGIFERGEEAANADNELNYVASVSLDPMGDMTGGKGNESWKQGDLDGVHDPIGTFGAGIMIGNAKTTAATPIDVSSTSLNLNTAWAVGEGITMQGEVFIRSDDQKQNGPNEHSTGWYAQGTYTLPKPGDSAVQWGFGARINRINTDNSINFMSGSLAGLANAAGTAIPGSATEISLVADAFYHGHACKTQIEYTWQNADPDSIGHLMNHILRIQFQLLF